MTRRNGLVSDWRTYRNGDFTVHINVKNGTKIRYSSVPSPIADFAENCDVTLTTRCSQGCPFCYLGCSHDGRHADIDRYGFLRHLHPYTELAINGNDLDHPQLIEFLQSLREQRVLANITVNQAQFMGNVPLVRSLYDGGLVHGIGVSLSRPDEAFLDTLGEFPTIVLHTIVGMLTRDDVKALSDAVRPPKMLLLGYKRTNRGVSYADTHERMLRENTRWLSDNVMSLADVFPTVSFDNKAVEQLGMRERMSQSDWERRYMGDDGTFTFYLDLVNGKYGLNSMCRVEEMRDIGDKDIDEMFHDVRR